jgi:hypothetical protein
MEEHGEVELEARNARQAAQGPENGNHPEARQHLQVLLVGVLELRGVGRRNARTDTQVVEDHVILRPGAVAGRKLGPQCLGGIDRHVPSPSP